MQYAVRLNENPKLRAFHDFLQGNGIKVLDSESGDTDTDFLTILKSIQSNNKSGFEKIYLKKSKSSPSGEFQLPFVNDDFLIFSMIIGVSHFDIDKSWLEHIVSIRSKNATTVTFQNLLGENFFSTANMSEVVLLFLRFTKPSLVEQDFLNKVYKNITAKTSLLESRNDFHILCAYRAYDVIIELKESPSTSEVELLRQFDRTFRKRIKVYSWILRASVFAGMIYAVLNLPKYQPRVVDIIEQYNYAFTIFGTLGISLMSNLIPVVRSGSQRLLMLLSGYPKKLIKNSGQNL